MPILGRRSAPSPKAQQPSFVSPEQDPFLARKPVVSTVTVISDPLFDAPMMMEVDEPVAAQVEICVDVPRATENPVVAEPVIIDDTPAPVVSAVVETHVPSHTVIERYGDYMTAMHIAAVQHGGLAMEDGKPVFEDPGTAVAGDVRVRTEDGGYLIYCDVGRAGELEEPLNSSYTALQRRAWVAAHTDGTQAMVADFDPLRTGAGTPAEIVCIVSAKRGALPDGVWLYVAAPVCVISDDDPLSREFHEGISSAA